ncbi:hypothetical protein I302_108554 [Kwoniella bestiolae CBS 10118]|uniref:NmrA-like domain-containing protein n=1 Tax=Kwoniella bestiolae CBS 10118 TaxID=1296100 RepID=A0A1B9FVD2_9TREE|nr:hypothetical protein I302_07073 [Kwoniella bestiolae CBS 10118]OCF22733.1 hypothetical protein I302_07073 [Kwoniella bestiolae CBS 10118]
MKVVVFTVTGDQGSSVARYLLEDEKYQVLGITRNVNSDKAKSLAKIGVELIQGDLSDPSTYAAQLEGIDAAYVNADFWTHFSSNGFDAIKAKEAEKKESIGAIDACVRAGVKHIVYSTLDEVDEGECPHYESKNDVSRYLRDKGIPHTLLFTFNYFSNIVKFGQLKRAQNKDDGWLLDIAVPDDVGIPSYPAEQTGLWVKEALDDRDEWLGKNIYATTGSPTPSEMAQSLSRKFNVKVSTAGIKLEEFYTEEHKNKIGEELWLAYVVILKGKMYHSPEEITSLPGAWTFDDWVDQDETLKEWFKTA